MRPAQHFDARNVRQIEGVAAGPRRVNAVEIDADRRLDVERGRKRADAADIDRRRVAAAAGLRDAQTGGELGQSVDADDIEVRELIGRNCGDRHRRFLRTLLATACGDNDVLDAALARLLLLSVLRSGFGLSFLREGTDRRHGCQRRRHCRSTYHRGPTGHQPHEFHYRFRLVALHRSFSHFFIFRPA